MKPVLKGDGSVDIERLKTIYPISLRLREFLQELRVYDMEEVFVRMPSKFELDLNNFWEPLVGAQVRSLFNITQKPYLDSIHKTSSYMFDFGADYMVQSLIWSGHKFLASCDAELKAKILERVANYPELEQTGPVYLCLALELIQSSVNAVLRMLTHALETAALKNIKLENVWTFTTILRGIVDQLRANNLLPADASTLVAKGLSKSSTPCFVSYIQQIQDNNSLGIKEYMIDDLLRHADAKYNELFKSNEWIAVGQSPPTMDTAFIVKDIICYNCKKKGHIQ